MSRVVVVTGASQGVGRAAARAFAERGDRVALIARDDDGLAAAAAEARERAPAALAAPADLADAGAVEAAAALTEDELGPIDVWVNAAMVSVFSPVAELAPGEVRRVTEVTYLGAVNGTLAALSRMRARDRGRIVQVGSALAFRAIPLQAAYCGAKFALRGFTDSLRTELLREGSRVTVTSVHLPAIDTPQFEVVRTRLPRHPRPVPPIYHPEVAAAAILHAADHGGRERWIGRSTIATILGERLAPALLDRYLARTGVESQLTDEPVPLGRPDNLEHPLPGDRGAHGRFGDGAATVSRSAWVREHLDVIGAGAALLAAAGLLARR